MFAYSKSHSELIKNFELLVTRTLYEPVITVESLSCINGWKLVTLGGRLSWSTEELNKPGSEAHQVRSCKGGDQFTAIML